METGYNRCQGWQTMTMDKPSLALKQPTLAILISQMHHFPGYQHFTRSIYCLQCSLNINELENYQNTMVNTHGVSSVVCWKIPWFKPTPMAMVLAMGMVYTGVGVVCESLPMVSPMLILTVLWYCKEAVRTHWNAPKRPRVAMQALEHHVSNKEKSHSILLWSTWMYTIHPL